MESINSQKTSRNKEREVFIEAYDQYIDNIYRFIYFKVGNREESQDLTSVVFLKTWDYLQRNKVKPKTLRALIYRIARNAIIDHYRSQSGSRNVDIEEGMEIADERQDLRKTFEVSSEFELVREKMMSLKDEYREVVALRFVEELSIGEIADILEKSNGSTRVLIYRALKALRELMSEINKN